MVIGIVVENTQHVLTCLFACIIWKRSIGLRSMQRNEKRSVERSNLFYLCFLGTWPTSNHAATSKPTWTSGRRVPRTKPILRNRKCGSQRKGCLWWKRSCASKVRIYQTPQRKWLWCTIFGCESFCFWQPIMSTCLVITCHMNVEKLFPPIHT